MRPQLTVRQVCFFIIAFLPVTKLFMVSSVIASFAKQDMWISVLINSLIDVATITAITFACQKAKTDFFGLLEMNFGKVGKNIILGFYLVFFLMKSILPINEQKEYVELTLYITSPSLLTFLPFFACAFFLCMKELRTVGRLADVIWIITLIGIILLFGLTTTNADVSALLPVGVNGISNILRGSYSSYAWYGDAAYVLFFIGNFKWEKRARLKILLSYGLVAVISVSFSVCFYSIFTSIAFRQRFALTEISKYATVINSIGRFDYIAIMLILFSDIISISLPIFFANAILQEIAPIKYRWIYPLTIILVIFLIVTAFSEYFYSIETFILTYGNAYFILLANVVPLFSALLVKNKKEKLYATSTR